MKRLARERMVPTMSATVSCPSGNYCLGNTLFAEVREHKQTLGLVSFRWR